MADEATQAPDAGQDTPTDEVSAPQLEDTRETAAPDEEGHAADEQQPDIDWEKRYNDLRPEFDRTTAAYKEAQQAQKVIAALQSDDPQERAWAADALGLELEEEAGPDDEDEGEQFRDPRVDQLLAEREAQQREQYLEQLEQGINSQIDELDTKHKTDLDPIEKDLIFARALSLPPGEDGRPPIEAAFSEFTGILDNRIKKYRDSKKAPSAPAPGGQSVSPHVQPGDRKSRLALANEVAERALRSQ